MRRVTKLERQQLHGFERVAFLLADWGNRGLAKRLGHLFLITIGRGWINFGTRHLQQVSGTEHLRDLDPERGVLLVSNHRSFFDMYVLSCVLVSHASFVKRLYFPVRSNFFYERPLGVFLNFILAMMSMYPPILRETHRRRFNRFSLEYLSEELRRKGTVVGFHPEGTRNKNANPFSMLPAQPGVGELAYDARATVVPVFIKGLSNNILAQLHGNFNRTGAPIQIVFGAPVDLSEWFEKKAGKATYQGVADRLRGEILKLSETLQPTQTNAEEQSAVA